MGKSSVARRTSLTARHLTVLKADSHMADAAPGWYYDPEDQAIYRFWDGASWTEHRSDVFTSEHPA